MSIIIGTVVSWIAVTVFSLIPKKLTPFEIIFLFCIDTIYELSLFSILHVNLKFIVVEQGVSNGIADLMYRLIALPLLLVVTSNILLYSNNSIKWSGVTLIGFFIVIAQQIMVETKMITYHHWNVTYAVFFVYAAILFSRMMTWVITSIDKKDTA